MVSMAWYSQPNSFRPFLPPSFRSLPLHNSSTLPSSPLPSSPQLPAMSKQLDAEEFVRRKQFDYANLSNLVLTAERSGKISSEPSGAPESLWGKMGGKMGDRARPDRPKEAEGKKDDKGKKGK